MITKRDFIKNYFLNLRYQRFFLHYCIAIIVFFIVCYTFVQTGGSQKNSPNYAYWDFRRLIGNALSGVKSNTTIPTRRERKLVLLWTTYFQEKNWLPSTDQLNCAVKECDITSNRSLLANSSAVILHWRNIRPEDLPSECPPLNETSPGSCPLLVLFNKEAPPNTPAETIKKLNGKIHLIASYRRDSDIYAPYGKIVKRAGVFRMPELNSNRTAVCWLVSHCHTPSGREIYVNELKRYVNVDIYGKCGNKTCPHESPLDCYKWLSERCKFYLSFENSICKDYSTEKLYYALMTDMVPLVMGGDDYARYLPSHSYIDVADFSSPKSLSEYLLTLIKDESSYLAYLKWKENYMAEFIPYSWLCDVCKRIHETDDTNLKPHESVLYWWFDGAKCGSLK